MKQDTLLSIAADENGITDINIPDYNRALNAIVNLIKEDLMREKKESLFFVLTITANILSRETSGQFEKDYIEDLKKMTSECREFNQKLIDEAEQRLS